MTRDSFILKFIDLLKVKETHNAIKSMYKYRVFVNEHTHFLDDLFNRDEKSKLASFAERIYCIMNSIDKEELVPRCKICRRPSSFLKYDSGYSNTCCLRCSGKYRVQLELEENGGKYRFQTEDFKQKSEDTCVNRYGFKNAFQSDKIRKKQLETIRNKYGVDNVSQCSK